MKVKPIPDGFNTISPYMAVRDPHGLLAFLRKAFDSKIEIHEASDGTVVNAMAQVGNSMVLIGQAPKDHPDSALMPAMLYLYVEDADAWYHKAIAAGGQSIREPADQVYGDRVGAVRDLANNQWWFATHKEDMSSEELIRRMEERRKQS